MKRKKNKLHGIQRRIEYTFKVDKQSGEQTM